MTEHCVHGSETSQLRNVQKIWVVFLQTKLPEDKTRMSDTCEQMYVVAFLTRSKPRFSPTLSLTLTPVQHAEGREHLLVELMLRRMLSHTRCSLSQQQQVVTFIFYHREGTEHPDQIPVLHW